MHVAVRQLAVMFSMGEASSRHSVRVPTDTHLIDGLNESILFFDAEAQAAARVDALLTAETRRGA